MEHLSNDHKDNSNQHENSHKLYNETGHLILSLTENQWKLRQQHEFTTKLLNGGKAIVEQMLVPEDINPKEQDCESHSQGSEQESYPSE